MKKIATLLLVVVLAATIAAAQSSGNFTYNSAGANLTCTLTSNGQITGGGHFCSTATTCSNGTCTPITANQKDCTGTFTAGIKTSSGNGNVFVIRPSMVIGLLTDVSITKNNQSSSALAGVDVNVSITPPSGTTPTLAPANGAWVTYDSRFIQISSNLFNALTQACVDTSTVAGDGCFFTFNESTVSAHSFDWIASNLSTGTYGVAVNWKATVDATQNYGQALTCVGPVNVTVQQNKVFSFNSINSF